MIRFDLKGKKFNRWLVIGKPKFHKTNHCTLWYCQCNCGERRYIPSEALRNNRSKSCGKCGTRNGRLRELNSKWKGYGEIWMGKWQSFQDSAKRRNIPFKVTIKYGWKIFLKQKRKCKLSGLELRFYPKNNRNASLDRKDHTKPYVKGNIQWVHKDINRMKWVLSDNKFIEYCALVVHNNSTK